MASDKDESKTTKEDYETDEFINKSHLLCIGNITFCLACLETIPESSFDKPYSIKDHLRGKKHSENVQSIFKMCFSDPRCNSYDMLFLDIVNNSDFHVPNLSTEHSCYVILKDNLYFCSVCQEYISKSNYDFEVITDTCNHLRKNSHQIKIKDNIAWIFYINAPCNYLIFNNSFLDCSSCNYRTFISDDSNTLHIIANHFQNVHLHSKQDLSNIQKDIGSLINNTVESKSGESAKLNHRIEINNKEVLLRNQIKKNTIIKMNEYFLFVENDTFVCKLCEEIIDSSKGDDLLSHCYKLLHNKILVENAVAFVSNLRTIDAVDFQEHIFSRELILSNLANDTTLMAHTIYITYDSKQYFCLLCKVSISASEKKLKAHFNNFHHKNALLGLTKKSLLEKQSISIISGASQSKISIALETMKPLSFCGKTNPGTSLKTDINGDSITVNDSTKYFMTIEGDRFICCICKIPLQIFKSNIGYSFCFHINAVHKTELVNAYHNTNCSIKTIKNMFSKFPDHLHIHHTFISLEEGFVFCSLCNELLMLSDNLDTASIELKFHLSAKKHELQFQVMVNHLSDGLSKDELIDLGELFKEAKTFENILENQTVLKKNIQFIIRKPNYYGCSLCDTEIKYFNRLHILIVNFNIHFSGKPHKSKLKLLSLIAFKNKYNKKTYVLCNSSSKGTLTVNEQSDSLLSVLDNNHEVYPPASHNDWPKITNQNHSESIIDTNPCDKNINQENVETLVNISNISRTQAVLKKLLKRSFVLPVNKNYFIEQNNNFFCLVCKQVIKCTVSGSFLKSHCYSWHHNNILIKNASKYDAVLSSMYTLAGKQNNNNFDKVLNLFTQNILLKSHVLFISYNLDSLMCTLCNERIHFTPCGKYIRSHFFTQTHNKKTYELNVVQSSNLSENCSTNVLQNTRSEDMKFSLNNEDMKTSRYTRNTQEFEDSESENEGSYKEIDVFEKFPKDISQAGCAQNALQFSTPAELDYEHSEHSSSDDCSINSNVEDIDSDNITQKCTADVTVMCPQCKEMVEVLNQDSQFSLGLHMQKHKDLPNIDNSNLLYWQKNQDYICKVCQKPILILNKDIALSVDHHLKHDHKNTNEKGNISNGSNRERFMELIKFLPDIYRQNELLTANDNDAFCKLCNCIIPLNSILEKAQKDLNCHLNQPYHIDQFKMYRKEIQSREVSVENQQNKEPTVFKEYEMFNEIIETHPLIKENVHFINKIKGYYVCSICGINISTSNFLHVLIVHFNLHFEGMDHKICKSNPENTIHNALSLASSKKNTSDFQKSGFEANDKRGLISQSYQTIIDQLIVRLSNSDVIVRINHHYFDFKGPQIYCKVCNEYVSERQVESHCLSPIHNVILNNNSHKFRMALKTVNILEEMNNAETKPTWNKIKKTNPYFWLPAFTLFLTAKEGDLLCLVCVKVLSISEPVVIRHLSSKEHREGSTILNCDGNVDFLVSRYSNKVNKIKRRLDILKKQHCELFCSENDIIIQDFMYYCTVCDQSIRFANSGNRLKNHLMKHKRDNSFLT